MTKLFILLPTLLLTGSPTQAQDISTVEREEYVMGNTVLTLYHEIAHALVDLFGLPVLGAEEIAADTFAIIEMLDQMEVLDSDATGQARYRAYFEAGADAWIRSIEERGELEFEDFQGEHPVDEARLYDMICLLVGYDAEQYGYLGEYYGLDEDYAEDCEIVYNVARSDWLTLLDRAGAFQDEADASTAFDLNIIFEPSDDPTMDRFRAQAETSELLQTVQTSFSGFYDLETPLTVRFLSCGEENAFYDPETKEVEMCYELMASYHRYWGTAQD